MILDNELLKEIEDTMEALRDARKQLNDQPLVDSQRKGTGARLNPIYLLVRDREAYLTRLMRIAYARKLDVPAGAFDQAFEESGILDGD